MATPDSHYLYMCELISLKQLANATLKNLKKLFRDKENIDEVKWHLLCLRLVNLVKYKLELRKTDLIDNQIMTRNSFSKIYQHILKYEQQCLEMKQHMLP